jgi:hypothetical protein
MGVSVNLKVMKIKGKSMAYTLTENSDFIPILKILRVEKMLIKSGQKV